MKKVADLTIVYAAAELTKQWYASEERREHFLAYARGVWEKSGRYNADSMVQKVIDHQCSPFELVGTYFDEFNMRMVNNYVRWYVQDLYHICVDEDALVNEFGVFGEIPIIFRSKLIT